MCKTKKKYLDWKVRGEKDIIFQLSGWDWLYNKVSQKPSLWRHKNEGLSNPFLGVFFPTSPTFLWRHMTDF